MGKNNFANKKFLISPEQLQKIKRDQINKFFVALSRKSFWHRLKFGVALIFNGLLLKK